MIQKNAGQHSARRWTTLGAVLAGLTVLLGAFGAHALPGFIDGKVTDPAKSLQNWQTASHYQMVHSIGIILAGICSAVYGQKSEFIWTCIFFLVGVIVFSGCLYVLAATDLKILGAFVPIGGVAMIAGWIALAIGVFRASGSVPTMKWQ